MKWRDELRQHLVRDDGTLRPTVLVVDAFRREQFGSLDTRVIALKSSPWLKCETRGMHDRGLEVFPNMLGSVIEVVIRNGKARRVDSSESGSMTAYVVGRIAYERIQAVDWSGDPYYGAPRVYVRPTSIRRDPFSEIVLYAGPDLDHLSELEGVTYVGYGGGLWTRAKRTWFRLRFDWRFRREERARRNQYDTD
jgi:hypothetical protein